jgi:hypothetical protein
VLLLVAGTVIQVVVEEEVLERVHPGLVEAGGKGVVILSVPTANYSSTTTGSPTVTTSGVIQ